MPFTLFADQPLFFLAWILAILAGIAVHEFSHALAGAILGDSTARDLGRLTLNPLRHIDPLGFLMLILVGFGWGRPVPFNPYNLKMPKWGPAIVGLAGPASNLLGVLAAGLLLKALVNFTALPPDNLLIVFLTLLVIINLVLMLFNLIPIPPLDGSKLLLAAMDQPKYDRVRFLLETRGPFLLILLIILDRLLGAGIFARIFGGIIQMVTSLFLT